jgi:hypothetical protein
MGLWIFAIVSVLIVFMVSLQIKRIMDKKFALKTPTLTTPLSEFRESNATDTRFKTSNIRYISNISEKFERMCILDPLSYVDDPETQSVVEQYGKLLRGELKDPEGRHMPSEFLQGTRNPDYEIYIKNQRKVLGNVARRESYRIAKVNEEDALRSELINKLAALNFPEEVLLAVLDDSKLNTYTANDWRKLATCVKDYLQSYSAETVSAFLSLFVEPAILCDAEKMEVFSVFHQYSAPMPIVAEIIRGRVTMDQGIRITKLVVNNEYDWAEAMQEVLEEDLEKATEDDLRTAYRQQLKA